MIKTDFAAPIEILEKLRAFSVWLEGRGLKAVGTRLTAYAKDFESTYTKPHSKDSEEFHNQLNAYTFAIREVGELCWILDVMRENTPPGFNEVMDKVLGGNPLSRDDGDNLNSRDFQFQLRIASYFIRAGYAVDLSQQADVIAKKDGFTFYVECKRIKSPKRVRTRIKEAFEQLRPPLKGGILCGRRFGVAALDVSKIIHPHLGLTATDSDENCALAVRSQLSEFCSEYEDAIEAGRHSRILDVWLQVLCPCFNTTTGASFVLFSSLHNPGPWTSGPKYDAFHKLVDVFESVDKGMAGGGHPFA